MNKFTAQTVSDYVDQHGVGSQTEIVEQTGLSHGYISRKKHDGRFILILDKKRIVSFGLVKPCNPVAA